MPDRDATEARQDVSGILAEFVSGLRFEDIPVEVVQSAKLHLLDALGVAAAGSTAEGIDLLIAQVVAWGGVPESHVLGTDVRVPAPWAALANGAQIHAKEFEDVHETAFVRPAGAVIASALAAAECNPRATGEDLIAGIVGGYEFICRIGEGIDGPIGFTRSGALGALAGAAAAARVLGFDAERTRHAVGIAFAQASTSIQAQLDAAMVKKLHPGFGAHAAMISVALAERGMTGNVNSLEGQFGYLTLYEQNPFDRDVMISGLGERWEALRTGFKLFPCAVYTHAPVVAALELAREGLDAHRIRRVQFTVAEFAAVAGAKSFAEVERNPPLESMFSIPYLAAAAFHRRGLGLDDLLEHNVLEPTVADLARRIDVVIDPDTRADAFVPIEMRVELDDGELLERRIDILPGSPQDVVTAQMIETKMRDCVTHARSVSSAPTKWAEVDVDRLIAVVLGIDRSVTPAEDIFAVLG
jgi:2-methylcitrate dehydratase PrpD